MSAIDSHSFRQLMGCFATGITVVTTRHKDGGAAGITVNSLTSVSLKPSLILFCLDKEAHVYPIFKPAKNFVINLLAGSQEDISRHFADFHHYAKPKNMWERMPEPVLKHTLGWMLCRKKKIYDGGDHDIFLCEVTKLHKRSGTRDPLLYYRGRYREIGN